MKDPRWLGILAVIGAAILWGTTGTVQAGMSVGRDPLAVGALRLIFGAGALILLALGSAASRRAVARLPWGGIICAGIAIGGYNLLFFQAVSGAGVGIGTAVAIGSAPIWATAFEIVIRGQWPGPLRAAAQGVSIGGVVLLGLTGDGPGGFSFGIFLALGAGGCYAAYSLMTSHIGRHAPATAIAAATFTVAALVTAPVLFVVPLDWLAGPLNWSALLFLGVGATGLAYALYTWGLTHVAPSTAVTLALTEPVTAWLLAALVIGEAVTPQGALGVVAILAGLVVVSSAPRPASAQVGRGRVS